METFFDIKGYEGIYQVSNMGRVKSLKRIVSRGINGDLQISEKIIKGDISKGYHKCTLSKNGRNKTFYIHQLLAMIFLNHTPNGHEIVVDHINNNKLDNRVENLQLITNRENCSKDKNNKTSKYTGVCWHKKANKWMVRIRLDDKSKYLGLFTTELEASRIYQEELILINKNNKNYGNVKN